jgi:DNA-binding GntR family transcriptional regulator
MSMASEKQELQLEIDLSDFAPGGVGDVVYEALLAAINEGRLTPGQRIHDNALAGQLGVSRTPVREALQRLRNDGMIEASAHRYTRVAIITPDQVGDALLVWHSLYKLLLEEVVPKARKQDISTMKADHVRFRKALERLDAVRVASANYDLYNRLIDRSSNAALHRTISSVVHTIRLGSLSMPKWIDGAVLGEAHVELIEALEKKDVKRALAAVDKAVELGQVTVKSE